MKAGANVEAPDTEYGRTPMSWAAKNGHAEVVELLVKAGANVKAPDTAC